MADLSDVMTSLVALIGSILYPSGPGTPSVIGSCISIFPGWPNPAQLSADLAAGTCEVSVYPRPEERNTTRYAEDWQTLSVNSASLTLSVVGVTVTVSGTIPAANNPHNVVVFANGKPYVYRVLITDALSSIAAALAALIAVDIPGTTAAGAVITLPSSARNVFSRVGVTATSVKEVRRQERLFQIGIWANSPANRDAIAKVLDLALAQIHFLALADGTSGRLIYKNSPMSDALEKTGLYRRDLMYTVEYGTTVTEVDTQATQEQINVSAAVSGVPPYGPVVTLNL